MKNTLKLMGTLSATLVLLSAFAFTTHAAEPEKAQPKPFVVIDNEVSTPDILRRLDPECIESVNVYKDEATLAKYGAKGSEGVIVLKTKAGKAVLLPEGKTAPIVVTNVSAEDSDQPLLIAEKMPTFQDGDLFTFKKWAESQIVYPAKALQKKIEGRVIFSFIVERDGSLSTFKVLQTPDPLLSDEGSRILASSPKWTPGSQRGELVRVKYTVPIEFSIPKSPKKQKNR